MEQRSVYLYTSFFKVKTFNLNLKLLNLKLSARFYVIKHLYLIYIFIFKQCWYQSLNITGNL